MRKMSKILVAVLVLLTMLSACKRSPGTTVSTPGDLNPTDGKQLHVSTGAVDVSGEFAQALCEMAWLDTGSLKYYALAEDGSFQRYTDDNLKKLDGSGQWVLQRDDQQYLALSITDAQTGEVTLLQELELYDSSIYAYGSQGESYVWLKMDSEDA